MHFPPFEFLLRTVPPGLGCVPPAPDATVLLARCKKTNLGQLRPISPRDKRSASHHCPTRPNRPGKGYNPLPRDGFKEGRGNKKQCPNLP